MICFSCVSVNILFEGETNSNNVCRDSSVGIVTRQVLEVRGIVGDSWQWQEIYLFSRSSDSLCSPLGLLFSGYRGHSADGKADRDMELTTHLF